MSLGMCRCYHYSTNDLDFNYSPVASADRSSNENDDEDDGNLMPPIPVRPDPMAVTKLLGIQRKISTVLDSISYELDRVPLPDGEDDLLRRQQRVAEFSTRLSRNYLYDLGRQMSDIDRHVKAIAPSGKVQLSRRGIIMHMQIIEQKLISAHQLLLAALSAYWKHIPSSVMKNQPEKLKEILQVVVQLKHFCTEIKLTPDFYCSGDDRDAFLGKETENRCAAILTKFQLTSDNESQVPSHTTRSTAATPSRMKKQRNKKMMNRLSMYTMDMRLAKTYQPKKTHSMFQMPRDRKHNCLGLKQQQSDLLTSKKLIKAPSEAVGNKCNKIKVPLKEDDIRTMMETVPSDLDADSPRSTRSYRKTESHRDLEKNRLVQTTKESERLLRNKVSNDKESTKDSSTKEKCFSSLVPVIEDLLMLVRDEQDDPNALKPTSFDNLYHFLRKSRPNNVSNGVKTDGKEEIGIGEKNMKLICYSAEEDDKSSRKFIDIKEHREEIIKFTDASCQAHYLKKNATFKLQVSDKASQCLTDYRNQYYRSLESNPMYTTNTQNKPWDIVAWISDKLIDELIIELSDDFQMEDVIQKLFELEFQEF